MSVNCSLLPKLSLQYVLGYWCSIARVQIELLGLVKPEGRLLLERSVAFTLMVCSDVRLFCGE